MKVFLALGTILIFLVVNKYSNSKKYPVLPGIVPLEGRGRFEVILVYIVSCSPAKSAWWDPM